MFLPSPSRILSLVLCLSAVTALAAEPDPPVEEMIVTATRNELNAGKVPASFSVISRAEIEALPAEDLVDLIDATPGITFNGIGIGGRRTFSVRGMSDSQTLILIDGRRQLDTNENLGYSDFGHNWIPLEDIERIEIVRGPLSSLWGAEALGGVVNIITRKPGDHWRGSLRMRTGIPSEDDGGEEFCSWLRTDGPVVRDRVGASVTVEQVRENNIPARTQPYPGTTIDAREEKKRAGIRSALNIRLAGGHTLDLSADYSDEERYTRSWDERREEPRDYDYNIKRSNLAASYDGHFGTTGVRLRAFRTYIKQRRTYVPQGDESLKDASDRILSGEVVHSGLKRHLLTAGGELRREELDVPGFNDGEGGSADALHKSTFLQDDFALAESWSLVLGGRYDHHEIFGGEFSPRAYTVWDATSHLQLKGGYGHGFRAPSLKQINPDYYYDIASMIIIGNPDLEPETADSFEIGARWRGELQGRPFNAVVTAFTNEIDNLIDTQRIGSEGRKGIYQPQNIREARTRGVETELGWLLGRGFRLDANWTHLDARDKTLDVSLTDRPRNTVHTTLGWRDAKGHWNLRLRHEYRSSQWLEEDDVRYQADGFGMWHASVSKDLSEALQITLGVDNITDKQLDEVSEWFNYYERGRFFRLGVRYRLD